MAIHCDVPGVEVTVHCNNQPLQEFRNPDAHDDDDNAAHPVVTKYIECINDANFVVKLRVSPEYEWGYRNHILSFSVQVDGKWIETPLIRNPHTYEISGLKTRSSTTGSWHLRRFKFKTVETVDDAQKERVERDMKVAKDLGTIKIHVKRKIEAGNYYGPTFDNTVVNPASFELAEKALKGRAVSHGTSYGSKHATPALHYRECHDIKEDGGPILSFKFLYRSRDALKRELIIPRSPPLVVGSLDPAERDRLAGERLEQLRGVKVKREGTIIKREFGESVDLTQDPPTYRATKKARINNKEVDLIDLTDD
ncbi:hypothetical protein F4808DRAFT_418707 [Astrocystis sublimbata]|nr:hypothetical protein F4808DRAFT_418707 [Astrocystis sublimbata]